MGSADGIGWSTAILAVVDCRWPTPRRIAATDLYRYVLAVSHASVLKDVVRESAKNTLMGVPAVRRWRINRPRAGAEFLPSLLERYAFQAVRETQQVIGSLQGKSIVEFGPGDTLSAGLALLAAGASSYTSLDRFVPDYSRPEAKRWYQGVRDGWRLAFPGCQWPADIDVAAFPEGYPDRVSHIAGAVEDVSGQSGTFDIVMSWQVGEHVEDIQAFANLTAAMLEPDGVAIHRVDFGPHDCWRSYRDQWMFLRFPSVLWRMMGSNRGYPNRRRHHEFVAAWDAAGLTVELPDTTQFNVNRIGPLRGQFASMPASSLMVQDAVYVCRRALGEHVES
jgi:hypothetical protein